jgi:hypothetical protein
VTALFGAVFGVFALSMVVIAVLAVRWGVQRDRATRRRPVPGTAPGGGTGPGPGGEAPVGPP